jgi:phospholipid N-methyltransferase
MISIFWCVFLLFIWFKTDFVIQYAQLFNLSDKFKITNWQDYRILNPKISYLEYLSIKHKSFFTKLISCLPCFLFWITLIISILMNTIYYFPITYILSYVIYKLIDRYV